MLTLKALWLGDTIYQRMIWEKPSNKGPHYHLCGSCTHNHLECQKPFYKPHNVHHHNNKYWKDQKYWWFYYSQHKWKDSKDIELTSFIVFYEKYLVCNVLHFSWEWRFKVESLAIILLAVIVVNCYYVQTDILAGVWREAFRLTLCVGKLQPSLYCIWMCWRCRCADAEGLVKPNHLATKLNQRKLDLPWILETSELYQCSQVHFCNGGLEELSVGSNRINATSSTTERVL